MNVPNEWNPDTSDPWYRAKGVIRIKDGRVHEHVIELRSRRTDEYCGVDIVQSSSESWPNSPKPWTDESQKRFIQYWERRNAGRLWRKI
jgi:hypothetical protein